MQQSSQQCAFSSIPKIIPASPSSGSGSSPPSLQMLPPVPSVASSFWQSEHAQAHLRNLEDTIHLLKAVQKELDAILLIKGSNGLAEEEKKLSPPHLLENISSPSSDASIQGDTCPTSRDDPALINVFSEMIKMKRINLDVQESLSLEAAWSLLSALQNKMAPLNAISTETSSWEERSVAVKLANKLQKSKRNKRWKKKKRKLVAEMLSKERERYEQADQDADEWRAREIAKDIAKRKVEKMKAIAKLKAKEERRRLESELELVLIVEKLQELRSIRIQKMKKQGHFLPEEDDKFLERVRAAVEEEERQAAAAADTDAARDAIATAESRKTNQSTEVDAREVSSRKGEATVGQDHITDTEKESGSGTAAHHERQGYSGGYDSLANLPVEFYHYYHGSNTDMGTLIEVRRTWDAYIRPGGSRIPGHWVQPPPPADDVWASYLVRPQ